MKIIAFTFSTTFLLLACQPQTDSANQPILSAKNQPNTTTAPTQKQRKPNPSLTQTERTQFNNYLIEYKSCKSTAKNRNDCRTGITKVLSEWFDLNEFVRNGEFVIHDSIRPIIQGNRSWEHLGLGNNSSALALAQSNANKGIPTVAIDQSQVYGSVVMIIPGKATKAGQWGGLMAPKCIHLTHVKGLTPFVDQSVAYAFKSGDVLHFYSKTGK